LLLLLLLPPDVSNRPKGAIGGPKWPADAWSTAAAAAAASLLLLHCRF
jgi:hypothetical protein